MFLLAVRVRYFEVQQRLDELAEEVEGDALAYDGGADHAYRIDVDADLLAHEKRAARNLLRAGHREREEHEENNGSEAGGDHGACECDEHGRRD